jgi:hypothetical protein
MKRENKFRMILTAAALFIAAGLFAQGIPGYGDGGSNNYTSTGTTYVTVGKTIPLFATPDSYYHPSYNPVDGSGLTGGFTWNWSVTSGSVTLGNTGSTDANYTSVTGDAVGTAVVNVVEEAGWATGCTDAGQDITVEVVAEPSIAFAATAVSTEDCEGGTFPAIEAVISGGFQNYRLAWALEIKSTDAASTETWYDDENGTNPAGAQKNAVEYTQASPEAVAGSGTHDITTVGSFNAINGESTEYIYTLSGLNDQASRWGDFLGFADVSTVVAADFVYYDTTDETITITVHPTPTTGPIFHIDSNWAN